jgi:hypothetical protein
LVLSDSTHGRASSNSHMACVTTYVQTPPYTDETAYQQQAQLAFPEPQKLLYTYDYRRRFFGQAAVSCTCSRIVFELGTCAVVILPSSRGRILPFTKCFRRNLVNNQKVATSFCCRQRCGGSIRARSRAHSFLAACVTAWQWHIASSILHSTPCCGSSLLGKQLVLYCMKLAQLYSSGVSLACWSWNLEIWPDLRAITWVCHAWQACMHADTYGTPAQMTRVPDAEYRCRHVQYCTS